MSGNFERSLRIDLDDFGYRERFDFLPIRRGLGLETKDPKVLNGVPIHEVARQVEMLKRATSWDPLAFTPDDLAFLRVSIPEEKNPFEIKTCPHHGSWYHDAFGCMHHDHYDPHPTDQLPVDVVCED